MANAIKFKHTNVPKQQNELGRFKVVQGPDYGAIYVIIGAHASIGRGEECDIQISDLKASRLHAELISTSGGWTIKDKGSANGILYNGKATREAKLKLNDIVTVGETTLEFTTPEAGTMMLVAPPRSMDQIQAEQKHLEDHKNKLKSMGLASLFGGGANSNDPSMGGAGGQPAKNKNRILIIVVAVVGLGLFLMPDGNTPKKPRKKKDLSAESRDLSSFLPGADPNRAADTFFKDGFREYLAGNFNRARTQFETVLQVSPGHPLATLYLENCNTATNAEINFHLEYGKKTRDAGKLREALGHYERILRLLYKDQSNENYVKAKALYDEVDKEIKGVVDLNKDKGGDGPSKAGAS